MGEEQEETGWKYLHGDVFRVPPHINLFSAMMGVGSQMFAIVLFIFALALVGVPAPACVFCLQLVPGTVSRQACLVGSEPGICPHLPQQLPT